MNELSSLALLVLADGPKADCGELVNEVPDCTGLLPLVGAGALWAAVAVVGIVILVIGASIAAAVPADFFGSWFERRALGLDPSELAPPPRSIPDDAPGLDAPVRPGDPEVDAPTAPAPDPDIVPEGDVPAEVPPPAPERRPPDPATSSPSAQADGTDTPDPEPSDDGEQADAPAGDDVPEEWWQLLDLAAQLDPVIRRALADARQLWFAVEHLWNGTTVDAERLLALAENAVGTYGDELARTLDDVLRAMRENPLVLDEVPGRAGLSEASQLALGAMVEFAEAVRQLRDAARAVHDAFVTHATRIDPLADAVEARREVATKAMDFVNALRDFKADVIARALPSHWAATGRGHAERVTRTLGDAADDLVDDGPLDAPPPGDGHLPLPAGSEYGALAGSAMVIKLIVEYLKRRWFGK